MTILFFGGKKSSKDIHDTYHDIWLFIDDRVCTNIK